MLVGAASGAAQGVESNLYTVMFQALKNPTYRPQLS